MHETVNLQKENPQFSKKERNNVRGGKSDPKSTKKFEIIHNKTKN